MNVLFAVWELDPFFKVGGLGDVARSLPAALKKMGADIRIILPFYSVLRLKKCKRTKIGQFKCNYDGKNEDGEIFQVVHPVSQVPVYLIKNKKYLSIASFPDTFAFFDKVVVSIIRENLLDWKPDILHCNDVHTGLMPILVRENRLEVKTLLTIHSLSYQGRTSTKVLTKLGIDKSKCKVLNWEIASKQINFLMEGIIHADVVTTVSSTYSREIMTEEFGAGLEEILRGREGRIFGILNGIDDEWRYMIHRQVIKFPYLLSKRHLIGSTDSNKLYSREEGKRLNKQYLQKKLGMIVDPDIPMISFIGRFDPKQKGIDIMHKMMRRLSLPKYQFVILGTGDHEWEERFQWLCTFYPKYVSCNFKFDDILAHQIYAASDFILIPSKFEPCGLIQMIAMLFGTLPIAHKTGGLVDSIRDGDNGFLFDKYTSEALEKTLKKALQIWRSDKSNYKKMVENAMDTDFSWIKSAGEYLKLYNKLVKGIL